MKRCDDENYVLTAVVAPRGDMLTNSILRAARWQSKCAAEVRAAAMTDRSVAFEVMRAPAGRRYEYTYEEELAQIALNPEMDRTLTQSR